MSQTKAQLIDPVDGTIVNADINASAAIAGTKISPNFGSQNITTTGQLFSSYATLTAVNPTLTFTDSNNNPDYTINVNSGALNITDSTNSADRLSINSSGNVGIGTSSPATLLHIRASSAPKLRIDDSDTSGVFTLQQDGTDASVHLSSAGTLSIGVTNDNAAATLTFLTRNNERLRIDSSGNLLLGTTTEGVANASKFTIATSTHCGVTIRSGAAHDGQIAFSDGTSGDDEFRGQIRYNHTSNFLAIATDAVERLRIDSSGQVGIGTTSPAALLTLNQAIPEARLVSSNSNFGMGDELGRISLHTSDGSSPGAGEVFRIKTESSSSIGADYTTRLYNRQGIGGGGTEVSLGNGQGSIYLSTNTAGNPTATVKMAVMSSGNVGIGTTTPEKELHVKGGSDSCIRLTCTDGGVASLQLGDASDTVIGGITLNAADNSIQLRGNNNNERMRIASNGFVSKTYKPVKEIYDTNLGHSGGTNYRFEIPLPTTARMFKITGSFSWSGNGQGVIYADFGTSWSDSHTPNLEGFTDAIREGGNRTLFDGGSNRYHRITPTSGNFDAYNLEITYEVLVTSMAFQNGNDTGTQEGGARPGAIGWIKYTHSSIGNALSVFSFQDINASGTDRLGTFAWDIDGASGSLGEGEHNYVLEEYPQT